MQSIIKDTTASKRRKTPPKLRKPQILALQAAGLTQNEIAAELGVSRTSIVRDLQELRPAQQAVSDKLAKLVDHITDVLPVKQRAEKYASLAMRAKNEAVSLGALQRIDDLDGIVTEKERIRAKQSDSQAPQPLFVFPAGTSIDFGGVTINQVHSTTGRQELLNNGATKVNSNGINDTDRA